MTNIKTLKAAMTFLFVILFLGMARPAFSGTEGYALLNNPDDVTKFEFLLRMKGTSSFTEEELIENGLPVSDDQSLVKTYRNIGAYIEGGKAWKARTEFQLDDKSVKAVFNDLKNKLEYLLYSGRLAP